MIMTAVTTDKLGRRPLTIYPYAVTSVSVLCLGIIGCFDYTKPSTSSLLVSIERIFEGSVGISTKHAI
jgi:hypothetical protein